MAESTQNLEKRQNRLEDAIERLTKISSDLSTMVAVQEQRISQQEKDSNILFNMAEKQKEDTDNKLEEVYKSMNEQEKNIFEEIAKFRQDTASQYSKLNDRISQLEKYIWMAIGGGIAASWIISYAAKYFNIVH
jgi:uncharacterized protein (UPF0297 family)